jgi:hypothetical protein
MRKLVVHVEDNQIIVNMTDSRLTLTYQLSPEGQLEENTFWAVDGGDMKFRRRARVAAQFKAHQLGWIHVLNRVA